MPDESVLFGVAVRDGYSPPGAGRRPPSRKAFRQRLVAMRYSHERSDARTPVGWVTMGLGDDLESLFQRTGTLHYFAVDGLKLGLIAALVVPAFVRYRV